VPHALRAAAPVAAAAALLIALSVACGPLAPPNPVRLPDPPTSLPPGPFQHLALSWALAAGGGPGDLPEAGRRVRAYLAVIAATGPRSRPELFPAAEDVIAYLVNAHLAWSTALSAAPELAGTGTDRRRRIPFPLDGERWSLAALEGEIARRAPADPRLGLWLDTGAPGRPPRPPAPLEGHAFGFLIDLQARRCGAAPGTWALDAQGRRLAVASWASRLPGLPDEDPRRTRRLLDVVPPSPALRQQILDVCGSALQRCRIAVEEPPAGR
jgi:hypothetical protein